MKKNIALFLITFLPLFLLAQNWKVEWGNSYKKSRLLKKETYYIGQTNNYYFINYDNQKENELLQFNHNHELVKTIPIGKKKGRKKKEAKEIIETKTSNYFISTSSNTNKSQTFVYATKLSNSNEKNTEPLPIFSYETNRNSLFKTIISPDSSIVLFSVYTIPAMSINSIKLKFFFFDADLGRNGMQEITLPKDIKGLQIEEIKISNKGEILILSKSSRKQSLKDNRRIPDYHYIVFRIDEEGVSAIHALNQEATYPVSATVFSDLNNMIYIAGVYTDGNKQGLGYGVFMMKYNKDNELMFFEINRFGEKIENQLMDKKQRKNFRTVSHFSIDAILIDYDNQEFSFVAENRYFTSYTTKDQMSLKERTKQEITYFSDDLIVPRFTFEGKLEWLFHLPKYYDSNDYRKTKSVTATKNGDIILVYNTTKSKEERKEFDHDRRHTFGSYYTDIVKIDKNGETLVKETIFHSRELETPFIPMISNGLKNGNILLQFQDKKKFQFGTLIFR